MGIPWNHFIFILFLQFPISFLILIRCTTPQCPKSVILEQRHPRRDSWIPRRRKALNKISSPGRLTHSNNRSRTRLRLGSHARITPFTEFFRNLFPLLFRLYIIFLLDSIFLVVLSKVSIFVAHFEITRVLNLLKMIQIV